MHARRLKTRRPKNALAHIAPELIAALPVITSLGNVARALRLPGITVYTWVRRYGMPVCRSTTHQISIFRADLRDWLDLTGRLDTPARRKARLARQAKKRGAGNAIASVPSPANSQVAPLVVQTPETPPQT